MKDITTVKDIKPSRLNRAYELLDDKFTGFYQAVENGQTRLALEYLSHIVKAFQNELHVMQDVEDEVVAEVPALAATAEPDVAEEVKKVTPKKTATKE